MYEEIEPPIWEDMLQDDFKKLLSWISSDNSSQSIIHDTWFLGVVVSDYLSMIIVYN